jgi:hypothetical protein
MPISVIISNLLVILVKKVNHIANKIVSNGKVGEEKRGERRGKRRAMRYALCVMRYALYVMRYTLCAIRYALYVMRYTLYALRSKLYTIRYTLYATHHTLYFTSPSPSLYLILFVVKFYLRVEEVAARIGGAVAI